MNIEIRPATVTDVPVILDLVKELAEFERAPQEVVNTAEQLAIDGFGKRPLFGCILAENPEQVLGFALYYYRYSTWKGKCLYLEDLYVKPEFRGFGVGTLLFDRILEIARKEACYRVSWQVLEWNEPAIRFYGKYKAGFDREWWNGFVDL